MPKMNALTVHAHRPAAAATLALGLVALLSACNALPGASPPPTTGPTAPPTTSGPTPTPTPTPSPTPVPSATFGADQIEHPTGATDIVLRMESGGGFVPMGFMLTQAPTFTLYGDGTVIFQQVDNRPNPGGFGSQAYLPWAVAHLDEDAIQALLQYALQTGRLLNAKDHYDDPMVADAPTTIFNMNAAGVQKVVTIYALGITEGADRADRAGFSQLAQLLTNFQTQNGIGDLEEYDAAKYKVILMESFGEPVGEALPWPWDDLTLADFPGGDEPGGQALLDKEHVGKLLDVPNGGHPGIWVVAPDDSLVQFGVRPLLPDEILTSES
jgi:hypothetical protein